MSHEARIQEITESLNRLPRSLELDNEQSMTEAFGQNVFTLRQMSRMLPEPVYTNFIRQVQGNQTLGKVTADAIAHAVKVWAIGRGATHFTHWFQPVTDSTAEKHDSFLSLKSAFINGLMEVTAMDSFSGTELLQSEPDASSFPSGGMRTTFEARGYTVWDTKSPMFIQEGPHGTSILYIPSVFISYNGEALDEKSVLLRSSEVLSKAAIEVLSLIESPNQGQPPVKQVYTTLGTEQEYFLVDRGLYSLRPDLKVTGRTLLGELPPRHQQLEDHYFGRIPSRALAAISECEHELMKLGVPLKTRHNEVALAQFEVAPIFEEATLAVDHNLLTMDVLHRVAHRHKLKVLFHEKPFKGVNGSSKHCNWSLSTGRGENLLDPELAPEYNYRFLIFLVAVLKAVHDHGDLLRAGIASASNDQRLGAHEAPPAIISVFLGSQLTEVLNAIEEGRPVNADAGGTHMKHVRVQGTVLDLKVATLPRIARDLTDRNRTSPFAFTGNKFKFRAVGSKQSVSFPMTLLDSAVAASLQAIAAALREQMGDTPSGVVATPDEQLAVIRRFIRETKPIRFEGDNYSKEWVKEAAARGLANITNSPEAFRRLLEPRNAIMLCSLGVFSVPELQSRYLILTGRYVEDVLIETKTLMSMVKQQVIPAALEYRRRLAEAAVNLKAIGAETGPELAILERISPLLADLENELAELDRVLNELDHVGEIDTLAQRLCDQVLPVMEAIRWPADQLEHEIDDKLWPLPKYRELFLHI